MATWQIQNGCLANSKWLPAKFKMAAWQIQNGCLANSYLKVLISLTDPPVICSVDEAREF
jgi:hypothetical protein